MTIEEMKARKRELGYSNKTLAKRSGVPIGTLQKIFAGSTTAPREETVRALQKALEAPGEEPSKQAGPGDPDGNSRRTSTSYQAGKPDCDVIREGAPSYGVQKKQGDYTMEDYLALPEDQRVELIDGVFYDMAAPTTYHQAIGSYVVREFMNYVQKKGGPCFPLMSPVDVQLDKDDKTIVQPDVMIVCDREKFQKGRVYGAPDFILEVLSPSTKKKDMTIKLRKYIGAGVREYWILDPKQKRLIRHDLTGETLPTIYGFEDKVPVLIWNGECQVDLKEMYDMISFLWD